MNTLLSDYPLTEHVPVNGYIDKNSDYLETSSLHNVTASDSEGGK